MYIFGVIYSKQEEILIKSDAAVTPQSVISFLHKVFHKGSDEFNNAKPHV